VELEDLSLKELRKLERDIAITIVKAETRARAQAMAALEAKARELGFSISELAGAAISNTKKRLTTPVKYRNPANPMQTWSGRGRRPAWFDAAIAEGTPPSALSF
jgi:DNA-binding protein H-NS